MSDPNVSDSHSPEGRKLGDVPGLRVSWQLVLLTVIAAACVVIAAALLWPSGAKSCEENIGNDPVAQLSIDFERKLQEDPLLGDGDFSKHDYEEAVFKYCQRESQNR